jgi:hypothetical protein
MFLERRNTWQAATCAAAVQEGSQWVLPNRKLSILGTGQKCPIMVVCTSLLCMALETK